MPSAAAAIAVDGVVVEAVATAAAAAFEILAELLNRWQQLFQVMLPVVYAF